MKLALAASVLFLSISAHASKPQFNQKRLLVKMKEGMNLPHLENSKRVRNLFGTLYLVQTDDLKKLQNELKKVNGIEYTEKDYFSGRKSLPSPSKLEEEDQAIKAKSSFNDPQVSKVWAFKDASKHGVSVEQTYRENPTSQREEIIVAVVDTGVDYNHEDLKDVMWKNPGEIAGNGVDDDGNGYVDDVYGIDTLERDADGNATGDPMDTHSHGTHVSGTIGATQNNSKGIAGIAGNVKMMGIRAVPNRGDETDVDVIESFLYAARNGAKIINCSFGKSHNEGGMAVKETIDHIGKTFGVLVIAAAGNDSRNIDSRPTYPASFDSENLLVVASTTSRGRMSYFSNYGSTSVDIAAPGSSVYSTTPNNRYSSMSGTSMASPTTAGVAAEVLSRYPHLTPKELKDALMRNVTKTRRYRGKMGSGGRVDLHKTVEDLK